MLHSPIIIPHSLFTIYFVSSKTLMASLFKDGCELAYKKVFSDDSPDNWCLLGYEGNFLIPYDSGLEGLDEMTKHMEDDKIFYGFLRLNRTDDGGDSKRVKFVFITWVGEYSPPLKRGKVVLHKKQCASLFKGFHIEKHIAERDALKDLESEIDKSLKSAGGANYDLGNTRMGIQAGNSLELKSASKKFFQEKERQTEIKNIVYTKGPLASGITPCDIGGRSFVASASEAKKNTVGYNNDAM